MRTHKKSYDYVYRGILVEYKQGYVNPNRTQQRVVVHTPDIERYFRNDSGVRRFIDSFLRNYEDNDFFPACLNQRKDV